MNGIWRQFDEYSARLSSLGNKPLVKVNVLTPRSNNGHVYPFTELVCFRPKIIMMSARVTLVVQQQIVLSVFPDFIIPDL